MRVFAMVTAMALSSSMAQVQTPPSESPDLRTPRPDHSATGSFSTCLPTEVVTSLLLCTNNRACPFSPAASAYLGRTRECARRRL